MAEPILSTRELTKSFGALKVTNAISLDILPGELHAIIGPNGAGKTTLIHQLAGSLASDGGHILYSGEDITRLPVEQRVKRGIARSFQITCILGGFSVLENVALAVQAREGSSFRFFGRADSEAALNAEAIVTLREVGLDARAQAMAGTLSHGEKRQLELALALATRPTLLLLDEPLAGTSHEESTALTALMRRLKGRHTIVLIEHDMEAVFALADRVSVLVYGELLMTGTPQAVRAEPRVRAAYLGEEGAA
jgi:branched-chain amino acid transport system ATP-binding protein